MGDRSDRLYKGPNINWAEGEKRPRTPEQKPAFEEQQTAHAAYRANEPFLERQKILKTQLPLFTKDDKGDYVRQYEGAMVISHIRINADNIDDARMLKIFTDAGLPLSEIACVSTPYPQSANLQSLVDTVSGDTRLLAKGGARGKLGQSIRESNVTVRLTDEQFQQMQTYYSAPETGRGGEVCVTR